MDRSSDAVPQTADPKDVVDDSKVPILPSIPQEEAGVADIKLISLDLNPYAESRESLENIQPQLQPSSPASPTKLNPVADTVEEDKANPFRSSTNAQLLSEAQDVLQLLVNTDKKMNVARLESFLPEVIRRQAANELRPEESARLIQLVGLIMTELKKNSNVARLLVPPRRQEESGASPKTPIDASASLPALARLERILFSAPMHVRPTPVFPLPPPVRPASPALPQPALPLAAPVLPVLPVKPRESPVALRDVRALQGPLDAASNRSLHEGLARVNLLDSTDQLSTADSSNSLKPKKVAYLILKPEDTRIPVMERCLNTIVQLGRFTGQQKDEEAGGSPSGAKNILNFINDVPEQRIEIRSKVISRNHAEFWAIQDEVFIRDTKSQAGTFLNAMRLSDPGKESRPYKLKTGDVVQFGVNYKGGGADDWNTKALTAIITVEMRPPPPEADAKSKKGQICAVQTMDSNDGAKAQVDALSTVEPKAPIEVTLESSHLEWFPSLTRTLQNVVRVGRLGGENSADDKSAFVYGSKVMSRHHAELWPVDGKVYVRDTKSQSGTFLNSLRLCEPGKESKPFRLTDGDQLQFGTDYKGEKGQLQDTSDKLQAGEGKESTMKGVLVTVRIRDCLDTPAAVK